MHLDPTSLRLFVRVLETGTIAAVAEQEFIAASAISKRISELEICLNSQLLVRTNRGVEGTQAGKALAQLSRGVLHQLEEVHARMHEYSQGVRGEVRIVANISAITQFLPVQLKTFLDQHPFIQIQLEERISSEIIETVAQNQADIGIFTEVLGNTENLTIHPYQCDRLALITANQHPLSQAKSLNFVDTLQYDYVGLHTGSAINNKLLQAAAAAEKTFRMRIQVTSYEALMRMVEQDLGIGIMPQDIARPYVNTHRIKTIPLTDRWASRKLKLCTSNLHPLSHATLRLLEHLKPSS
ncbi:MULTISPECIES: LysR family transcriptional regulator [unclassified Marinobacter]|uniref:LysR family transcriptional regulator n=1 Tax=unclassified Marinobacter TaxID=83889 RepID=UPI00200E0096|nr:MULTISPECIES: LysR family transcriptional regulator [unclassified Marinobacter]UQG57813.1 LysR family transcriptional regulator [Marinobacter sp. M4C]UQG66618.1 LysR family transcriptional regulator [Marinobacter sp. M2C]UQG70898.1 LysR family transcriptional regulator [Marinobacter sp. M1C]